jgi:hypothetical protein
MNLAESTVRRADFELHSSFVIWISEFGLKKSRPATAERSGDPAFRLRAERRCAPFVIRHSSFVIPA